MDEKAIELLERIAIALEQQNGIPVWKILINIIPWVGVLITIAFLLIERIEKQRPYLEISFELVRSTLACLVIRNVGTVPAELKSMKFNSEFIEQLEHGKIQSLKKKQEMNVVIYPGKSWILSLDKNVFDVIGFSNTELKIEYEYSKLKTKKTYSETATIDFEEYASFLVYLSEIDELKTMTEKKLTEITKLCDKMIKYMDK